MHNIETLDQYLAALKQIIAVGTDRDWLTPTNLKHLSEMVDIKTRRIDRKKKLMITQDGNDAQAAE